MFFETRGLPLGFAVTDLPFGIPISGSFVSALVPLRDNDLPLWGGAGHDIGEELPIFGLFDDEAADIGGGDDDEATEIGGGVEATEIGEAVKGLPETGTFTPSVDDPGGRPTPGLRSTPGFRPTPSIAGGKPYHSSIANCCCYSAFGGVLGGDSNTDSKSRRYDEDAGEYR